MSTINFSGIFSKVDRYGNSYCDNVEVHIKDFFVNRGVYKGTAFVCINSVVATNALTT